MGSSSKRRQTMAKMNRERALKEKRERKAERKEEKKEMARAIDAGEYVLDEFGNPVPVASANGDDGDGDTPEAAEDDETPGEPRE